jgi:hypothetical protein
MASAARKHHSLLVGWDQAVRLRRRRPREITTMPVPRITRDAPRTFHGPVGAAPVDGTDGSLATESTPLPTALDPL